MASAVLKFGRVIRRSGVLTKPNHRLWQKCLERKISASTQLNATTELFMPSLSPTMSEGTIVKWYKNEGDKISPGDILCDIQTDKAVVSFDIEEEGILAKILKQTDAKDIKVGTLIALMVEEDDDWQNVEVPVQTESSSPTPSSEATPTQQAAPTKAPPTATPAAGSGLSPQALQEALHMSGIGPSVRKLIAEYGVDPKAVSGSGPHQRVTKGDVLKYIEAQNLSKQVQEAEAVSSPAPTTATTPSAAAAASSPAKQYPTQYIPDIEGEEFVDIPNTGMRTTIAKRLSYSKQTIPHSYVAMECNVGPVTQLRKKLKGDNVKVSVNDFIIKSAAVALQRVPQVNSVWQNEESQPMATVDICVAVATESGLITPIVKNAPTLGVDQISAYVKDLADRARQNKLKLHEFQGGSFTISNLGMFGISEFSAIINPPQTAIMAVGSSHVALGQDGKPESRMTVTLCYDARVIDMGEASQFLEVFRDTIENPRLLLSGSPASKRLNSEMF